MDRCNGTVRHSVWRPLRALSALRARSMTRRIAYTADRTHPGSRLAGFPIVKSAPLDIARALESAANRLSANLPAAVSARAVPTHTVLRHASTVAAESHGRMIALQEELDWRCY